jgi:tRNA(Ile)-lysidine synthase
MTSPAPRVAEAASGGRDSTALLHCTLRQARPLGIEVWALHVHHGLQPTAYAWATQVRKQARRWGAAFDCRRLAGAPAPGESLEAWARRGRYAALAEMAHAAQCPLVLLAHHRRDQAETVLLQALRGGGAAALAAMPRSATRNGIVWARPWLDRPRELIEAYLRRHRLRWVDDPSNEGTALTRSRLRQDLWPTLLHAFPQAESALLHTALRAADEREILLGQAQADLAQVCSGHDDAGTLPLPPLLALPPARARQVLRLWLREQLTQPVPETLVRRLSDELPRATAGRWPAPGGELRARRGSLAWHSASPGR